MTSPGAFNALFTMFRHANRRSSAVVLLCVVFYSLYSCAQDAPVYARTRALEEAHSEAERQAENIVSLSPGKLIALLQQEPGLLLEVKKLLVRKAFEQGRILESRDLTDDALFRLLREDDTVRVLATQEVSRRLYVRALPTREERRRSVAVAEAPPAGVASSAPASAAEISGQSKEDRYWSGQEHRGVFGSATKQPSYSAPASPDPSSDSPQSPDYSRPRLDLGQDRAAIELRDWEESESVESGGAEAERSLESVRPEELPGLLRAGAQQALAPSNSPPESDNGWPPDPQYGSQSGPSSGSPFASRPGGDGVTTGSMGGAGPSHTSALPRSSGGAGGGQGGSGDYQQQAALERQQLWPQALRPDHAPLRRRANPYADVPSLYDLYEQYGGRSPKLARFAGDVFRNGTGNIDALPMDLPVGLDYVLGPGDDVNINLSGGVSQRLRRVVDGEGRIALPESGAVQVAGRSLGEVQLLVQTTLQTQFHNLRAQVSLARLRTVRVYVVGDVERPGAYDISSLSTPLNALFQAGGPTARGSLRTLRHYRGAALLQELDVYDLLLRGVRSGVERLQSGDTVLVPPLGPEITVEGMVRRPAIYELRGEKSLAEALELAGGVLSSGTLRHVDVERIEAHTSRTMLRLDLPRNDLPNNDVPENDFPGNQKTKNGAPGVSARPARPENDRADNPLAAAKALEDFLVQDGDRIKISPILPYADKTVYLEGHVFRPGKYAFREGMALTDLIPSYADLLPEPAKLHAEIVRLNPPDLQPQVIAFNLDAALGNKSAPLPLRPFDTVRVFSRFDFEDPPVITIAGEVRDPGDHLTNGATRVRDALYLAGGLTGDASPGTAQIFRRTGNRNLLVFSVDLEKAMTGDEADNIPLEPKDRLVVQRNLAKTDPPTVTIAGEVGDPGKYPLGRDMTAAQLVRTAGGLRRGAFPESADLTRYSATAGQGAVGEHETIALARALAGEPDTDVRLRDGDVLTVREAAGWRDVGASITVGGEVMHPGTYGIEEGERLSSILDRAGGLRADAYPYGAIFERVQVRLSAEQNRAELMRNIQNEGPALQGAPATDANEQAAKNAALMQWRSTLEKLEGAPPAGRMVIHIYRDFRRWRNTSADIPVRAGDSIYLPKTPSSITVEGAVYNPTAVAYHPGKSAGWYLGQAGGPNNTAFKKGIFVVRSDGSVAGGAGGMFRGGVETAELRPGDTVVVPEKAFSANTRWKSILEGSQIAYAVGIAIQVARTF